MRLSTPLMYLFSISVEYHSARLFVSHFNKVKEWKIEIELRTIFRQSRAKFLEDLFLVSQYSSSCLVFLSSSEDQNFH